MQPLIGYTNEELSILMLQMKQPAYRGKQVAGWLYHKYVSSIEEMSDIPVNVREILMETYTVGRAVVSHVDAANDGTAKYLFSLSDDEKIESVFLPYADRVSICISTQAGCPAGCVFCATGLGGLARNLTAGEIVDQVLSVQSFHPNHRISHVVYMGMGEPLLNYDSVIKSLRILCQEVGISARRITLSTVGIVPGIIRLAEEGIPVTLALSLHAPDDELRASLIPTARKWKLEEILSACRSYFHSTGRNLTFEYLMIADINDSTEQAKRLADILKGIPGNVNLIPFNHVDTIQGFRRPSRERIKAFRDTLEANGRTVTQRMERGRLINAACGQLAFHAHQAASRNETLSVAGL